VRRQQASAPRIVRLTPRLDPLANVATNDGDEHAARFGRERLGHGGRSYMPTYHGVP
jgi:hypothetical protein